MRIPEELGCDIISFIDPNEEILDWLLDNGLYLKTLEFKYYPFKEFCLLTTDGHLYCKIENNSEMKLVYYERGEEQYTASIREVLTIHEGIQQKAIKIEPATKYIEVDETELFLHICKITNVMQYITNYKKEYVSHEQRNTSMTKSKRNNQKSTRVIYITGHKYINTISGRREIVRKTDSWTVRGHWRTKGTDKIWINPYKKGPGKVKAKVYRLG